MAHASPAAGYEVSIYGGTPTAFWVGVAVALLAAVVVSAAAPMEWPGVFGAGLGGLSVTTIVALPLLRSYHFYGSYDALTHLGWVRSLSVGALDPWEFIYPGPHMASTSFGLMAGTSYRLSTQLIVVVFTLAYIVFVPLLAHRLTGDRRVVLLAAFSALLLLPVNHTGFNMLFYPFALATFFVPFALYLLVEHTHSGTVEGPTRRSRLGRLFGNRAALLFVLVGTSIVLYHPQVATDLLAVMVGIVLVQVVARRSTWLTPGRPVYGLTGVVGLVFLLWSARMGSFQLMIDEGMAAVGALLGSGSYASGITDQTTSASDIGVGLGEIFVKLFLLDAVFVALGGLVVLAVFTGRLYADDHERRTLVAYLAAGTTVAGLYAGIHLFGPLSELNFFFRHQGFMLVPLTVLGAIGLGALGRALADRTSRTAVRAATPPVAAVVLTLALVVVYPSPFVYLPSQQVTAEQMTGHRMTFQHADDLLVVGVRDHPDRYDDSLPGADARTSGDVSSAILEKNLTTHYDDDVLLAITRADVDRETRAYRSLRYSEESFESVENRPGVARVVTNGEYTLYHVDSEPE